MEEAVAADFGGGGRSEVLGDIARVGDGEPDRHNCDLKNRNQEFEQSGF